MRPKGRDKRERRPAVKIMEPVNVARYGERVVLYCLRTTAGCRQTVLDEEDVGEDGAEA